jgi:hypothetical protein
VVPSPALIDPFGVAPLFASRLPGLGGPHPSPEPSYVFHTPILRPALGEVTVTIWLRDLKATRGTFVVQLTVFSAYPGTEPSPLRIISVSLAELATVGGQLHISFISRRNMFYSIVGSMPDDTDAIAADISITLDRCATEERVPAATSNVVAPPVLRAPITRRLSATEALLTRDAPTLRQPVSQGWSRAQCAEPQFAAWMKDLRLRPEPTAANWRYAYILQGLRSYGALREGAVGLGMGVSASPLPAALAAEGCRILAATAYHDTVPEGDPGLALEELLRPDICPPEAFFARVHFAILGLAPMPEAVRDFDFVWSMGVADRARDVRGVGYLLELTLDRLKPGGLAIHILTRSNNGGLLPDGRFSVSRQDIEGLALSLISRNHEVAQIKFSGAPDDPSPFGVIARRR